MPLYHKLGTFPKKTYNSKTKWRFILRTALWHRRIFTAFYLTMLHRPTQVKEILKSYSVEPKIAMVKHQIIIVKRIWTKTWRWFLDSRKPMLVNKDCTIGLALQKSLRNYFYKMPMPMKWFSSTKEKENYAPCGEHSFEYGDYLIIPGMIYQIDFDTEENRLFTWNLLLPFIPQKI
jgi:homogentisate 1,2-dioxygenase